MDIGIKIRQAREAKNIKQQDMAAFLGIAQSAYNLLENGKRKINTEELIKIAEKLETPIEKFFSQENAVYNIQQDNIHSVNNLNYYAEKFDAERQLYEKMLQEKNTEIEYLRGLLTRLTNS